MNEFWNIMKVVYEMDNNIWLLGSDIRNRIRYKEINKKINFWLYEEYLKLKSRYNKLLNEISVLEDKINIDQTKINDLRAKADCGECTLLEIYTKIQDLQVHRREVWNECVSSNEKIKHIINRSLSKTDLKIFIHLLNLPLPNSENNYFDEEKELKQTLLNWFDVGIVDDIEKWKNFLIDEPKEIIKIR